MIVVTGGAGFIGSACVWELNRGGVDEILIVDNLGKTEKWRNISGLRFQDYLHKSMFLACLESGSLGPIDAIVHMGACSSTGELDADYLMENNYHFSRRLAEYAISHGIRLINASSAATYGDGSQGFSNRLIQELRPLNMYGYSKYLFDLWAQKTGALKSLCSLRFFNVYGPNEYHKGPMRSVVLKAFEQMASRGYVELFESYRPDIPHGAQRRDFVYVEDCAQLITWLFEARHVNGVLNVGTGQARTFDALAKAVADALGASPDIRYISMPEELRAQYQYFTCAEMEELGLLECPVSFRALEEGVRTYVEGYLTTTRYLDSTARRKEGGVDVGP